MADSKAVQLDEKSQPRNESDGRKKKSIDQAKVKSGFVKNEKMPLVDFLCFKFSISSAIGTERLSAFTPNA
ncbi:unnamed protein product [Phytophthora fragariaefolia]|uniref:Unnamed protein product n=1 Tax=Phytophthora fragariaefolia TaxID=1490495 RepID=A0A9W7CQW5_9STRA|nr:unnamed protein product [Phytophthora fragariaefolia]